MALVRGANHDYCRFRGTEPEQRTLVYVSLLPNQKPGETTLKKVSSEYSKNGGQKMNGKWKLSVQLNDWGNFGKHYLADLDANGIPIVPSRIIERGSMVTLHELLDESGWDEAILKPCISGAARHTYRVNRASAAQLEPVVRQLLADESLILQPFQESVMRDGEDTLMFFNGSVTHAVRKVPKPGDFRVQDDCGGTVQPHEPSAAQINSPNERSPHVSPHQPTAA